MDRLSVGKFIAEQRKAHCLTQKELAEKVNVTDKAVSKWETGKGYPDIETMKSLADVFDVSISELLEGKKVPEENLADICEEQVIKQIKNKNKSLKKYRIILLICLIVILAFGYAISKDRGIFDGVKYAYIDCYSNDVVTILNNVDGYISQRPKAEGEFLINSGHIFLESDRSSNDIYLSGTCENGRSFYISTLYEKERPESSYCFIGEMRQNTESLPGITMGDLKNLIVSIDVTDKTELDILGKCTFNNQDLYPNDYQNAIAKYIYTNGKLTKCLDQTISGEYIEIVMFPTSGDEKSSLYGIIYYKIK